MQAAAAQLPALPRLAGQAAQDAARGAVAPSLGTAVEWLRGCVRQRPGLRMQARPFRLVIVGSLQGCVRQRPGLRMQARPFRLVIVGSLQGCVRQRPGLRMQARAPRSWSSFECVLQWCCTGTGQHGAAWRTGH